MLASENFRFDQAIALIINLHNIWLRNFPTPLQWIFIIPLIVGFLPPKSSKFKLNLFFCCLIWLVLILVVAPIYGFSSTFSRIWLPHSVFFYITLAMGINHLIDWLQKGLKGFFSHSYFSGKTIPLICIFLLFMGVSEEIRKQYIYHIKNDSFQDAKMVTDYLQNHLQEGDLIMAPCPRGMPLAYEFSRYNIPLAYLFLHDELGNSQQIYLYGDHKKKIKEADLYLIEDNTKTLDEILKQINLKAWFKQPIEKVVSFEKTTVYRIHVENVVVQ